MTLKEYLANRVEIVERTLHTWVPAETVEPEVIHRAMRYSLFAGGKRIRPVLCMAAGDVIQPGADGIADAAVTLEMIHTYSLIHDDLPALDNDDLRRGQPTNHKVFGEAMAILAGDSLLTLAFQVLGSLQHVSAEVRSQLVVELASASGTVRGMIGGQVHDIEGEGMQPNAALLEKIHRAKTGALLRASVRMGAIYAGANAEQLAALSEYGEHTGLAFQIVDDILDIEESSEALGKTAGKDLYQQKITFPAVYGLAESKRMAEEERQKAHAALAPFGDRATRLIEIADLIVDRKS
ncbi:polyprenyl synthetase family protein [Bryobacter aggregatus]|uniref:polyprenyl synthetase family protein n=1 Tax=Bryobacter aggregatus TaxID=360054 RepID=UPI0004E1149E|nr:farnesyl diphosphate synthase [Bryobacter aggregatus]